MRMQNIFVNDGSQKVYQKYLDRYHQSQRGQTF